MTTSHDRARMRERAAAALGARFWTRQDLLRSGLRRADIRTALATERLIRTRRDRYVDGIVEDALVEASRRGGRLTCLSLLRLIGVFVLEDPGLHIQVPANAARLPSATHGAAAPRVHWGMSDERRGSCHLASTLHEAVGFAIRCQPPRAAVATIDSAAHLGLLSRREIREIFRSLPRKYRVIEKLIDPRAESGPETLMRLLVRGLCRTVELQVRIDGVGRVDLLVDGWLVIECDSTAHHAGPDAHRVDRARDLALAARGYSTLRPMAEDIMWRPERVVAAVRGLLAARASSRPGRRR